MLGAAQGDSNSTTAGVVGRPIVKQHRMVVVEPKRQGSVLGVARGNSNSTTAGVVGRPIVEQHRMVVFEPKRQPKATKELIGFV